MGNPFRNNEDQTCWCGFTPPIDAVPIGSCWCEEIARLNRIIEQQDRANSALVERIAEIIVGGE